MKRLEKKLNKSLVFICIELFPLVLDHTEQESKWMANEKYHFVLVSFAAFIGALWFGEGLIDQSTKHSELIDTDVSRFQGSILVSGQVRYHWIQNT